MIFTFIFPNKLVVGTRYKVLPDTSIKSTIVIGLNFIFSLALVLIQPHEVVSKSRQSGDLI